MSEGTGVPVGDAPLFVAGAVDVLEGVVEHNALLEIGALFAVVALAGAVAVRLGQSVIPFYIVGGMLFGPFVVGDLTATYLGVELAVGISEKADSFVEIGAELGIVFLLFFLGLEFNIDRLVENSDRISKAGLVDLGINFGVGFVLGYVLFGGLVAAFAVAGMVYISSSAIITKSLIDLGWIANAESSPMLGTLVFEDLFIAVYLAVLSALVVGGGDVSEVASSVAIGVAFLVAVLLLAHLGTDWLAALLETDSHEFKVLRATGVTVLVAGAALAFGVSEAVAAFFVGMGFSTTGHREDLEHLLEPLRDVFAAVFFFWIGLVTDPVLFLDVLALIAVAAVVTAPTKFVSGFWGGKVYGLDDRRSTRVALGMVTRGEFTLIIASIVLLAEGAVIPADVAAELNAFAVGYVLVMSILGTTLMQHATAVEERVIAWRGGRAPAD